MSFQVEIEFFASKKSQSLTSWRNRFFQVHLNESVISYWVSEGDARSGDLSRRKGVMEVSAIVGTSEPNEYLCLKTDSNTVKLRIDDQAVATFLLGRFRASEHQRTNSRLSTFGGLLGTPVSQPSTIQQPSTPLSGADSQQPSAPLSGKAPAAAQLSSNTQGKTDISASESAQTAKVTGSAESVVATSLPTTGPTSQSSPGRRTSKMSESVGKFFGMASSSKSNEKPRKSSALAYEKKLNNLLHSEELGESSHGLFICQNISKSISFLGSIFY
jgi:hypothetical protein